MYQRLVESTGRPFTLFVTIKTEGKKTFRVIAADNGKKNSKYADRVIDVEGERHIFLSFPISPKSLVLAIGNIKDRSDSKFTVQVEEGKLNQDNFWLDNETRSFVQMAIIFSQICGFTTPPQVYKSSDDLYTIKFFDVIRDQQTNMPMTTPARIGHSTGNIEVSKKCFDKYTIPMRMIILLHEFSHKFRNPKMGLAIEDETGADINALYIYLSMGFSKIDAIYVFANVFLKAQTQQNIKRMRDIMNYINNFEEKKRVSKPQNSEEKQKVNETNNVTL